MISSSLTKLTRFFSLRANNKTLILPRDTAMKYTREDIIRLKENANWKKELEQKIQVQKEKEIKEKKHGYYFNEENEKNRIQVKINKRSEDQIKIPEPQEKKIPFIIHFKKEEAPIIISGKLGRVKGSTKKINPVIKQIRGLHLFDAMSLMQTTHKRSADSIFRALRMTRTHALNMGKSDVRLFVKEAVVEKQFRSKRVYYHAKMKTGMMFKDYSRLVIKLEEKKPRDFFKMFIAGKAPPALAKLWREQLLESDASYEKIKQLQFVLTAKGRQQRREMIKRRAYKTQSVLKVAFFVKI